MPSTVCPIPTAVTPADAHAMFLKKKKEMPGLTPAAWRKAAAQEMGLDYDTYLAIWKLNQGKNKKVGMVAESTPTKMAAQSSSPSMGIPMKAMAKKGPPKKAAPAKVADVDVVPATQAEVYKDLSNKFKYSAGDKPGINSITKVTDSDDVAVVWHWGDAKNPAHTDLALEQVQEARQFLESLGYVTTGTKYSAVKFLVKGKDKLKISDPAGDLAEAATKKVDDLFDQMDDMVQQAQQGLLSYEDVHDILGDTLSEAQAIKGIAPGQLSAITQKVDFIKKDFPLNATAKAVDDALDLNKIDKDIDDIVDGYKGGILDDDMVLESVNYMKNGDFYPGLTKATIQSKVDDLMKRIEAAKSQTKFGGGTESSATAYIKTPYGPLDHTLAQNVYKQMKKDMPGATPATLRHAAAEYLGVDYNDYLKAWKKPGTVVTKAQQTKKLPTSKATPVSPTSQGKYAKQDINPDQLKDELARAYGPSANKAYINLDYNDANGSYTVQLPQSLLPTQAARDAVIKQLESLGLKVAKKPGNKIEIKSPYSVQTAKNNAKQIKSEGTFTLPNGTVAWDIDSANSWSDKWWQTLTAAQRSAVKSYTGSGYRKMNGDLRRGMTPSGTSNALSSAMRSMDHEFTVFRGTDVPIDEFAVGGLWSDAGFMSTAVSPGKAWSGVKFEILIPKGTKGAYVDPYSSAHGEKEFIIDRGTKFRVIEVDRINRRVKMVAIPH